jgi:hypothetical protein
MTCYKVHFPEQTVFVEASDDAEAYCIACGEVECDSIDEVGEGEVG